MAETINLKVTSRNPGKHSSRQLRKQERIPAVIYGPDKENLFVSLSHRDAARLFTSKLENAIFQLESENNAFKPIPVLLKDSTRHPVSQRFLHVDFYAPDMSKPVVVSVRVQLNGTPIGAADGGILQTMIREIEVECLPKDIPDQIDIDVSGLALNNSIHIRDLKLPAGVKPISKQDLTVVTLTAFKEEIIAPPPPEGTPEGILAEGVEGAAPAEGGEEGAAAAAAPGAAPAAGAKAAAPGKEDAKAEKGRPEKAEKKK